MNKTTVALQAKTASFLPFAHGMLQRKCACGNHTVAGGECAECAKDKHNLQRKLSIGATNDPLELEADRVAQQVTSTPLNSAVNAAPPRIQRFAGPANDVSNTAPASVDRVLAGSGRPLEPALQKEMGQRFGHDFSQVRIHTGDAAEQSARDVNANAYTVGNNVVFGAGRFAPGSHDGRRLLAHELTHVVQQSPANEVRAGQSNAKPATTLSRQTAGTGTTSVTVEAPTGPTACGLEQHRVIEPSVQLAQNWLKNAIQKLTKYIGAPADRANAAVRDAMDRHFHTASIGIAGQIRDRLETIRSDMIGRNPFIAECHGNADTSCTNSGAYIPGVNQSMIVFCPNFFSATTVEWRAGALVHEMAHALLGLRIADRAYARDRLLPFLSTAEALDNAENYAQLTEELATGRAVKGNPPEDEIEDCSNELAPLVKEALGRAQRWNRDSETVANDSNPAMVADTAVFFTTHLGNALPATRNAAAKVFSRMVVRLREPIDIRCDSKPMPACGRRTTYRKAGSSNVGKGLGIGAAIGGGLGLLGVLTGLIGGWFGLGLLGLGALIGLIAGAATSTSDSIHICPNWKSLPPSDRTESLLSAIYETYAGLSFNLSQSHASLARALHERYIGQPPPPPQA